ncbi:MAG: ATP-dependent protease, partial [Clostridia bacterium]|nr:ATP-dependent protease [Clostridia bacterium]
MEQAERFQIPVAKLRRVCDLDTELDFCASSQDVPGLEGVIGQDRAVRSMQFGLAMDAPGYNIFVSGQPGTGKTTYVNASVTKAAADGTVPDDWCYVNNFIDKENPVAISLPAGQGRQFQKDMDELVRELRAAMPKAFESSDYEQKKKSLETSFQSHMQERLNALQKQASEVRFLFRQAGGKLMIMPLKDEKPYSNQEFSDLPDEQRQSLEATGHRLESVLEEILREGKSLEKQTAEKIVDLEKQIARAAATPSVDRLREKYEGHAKVLAYLEAVRKDIEENRELFLELETEEAGETTESSDEEELVDLSLVAGPGDGEEFTRYKVNLFISHEGATGAPVILETNPNYYNLFGKVEYKNQLMSVSTDFTMVKPGAIHRANGGYLILQARDALIEPLVWEQLKRTLKYRQAVIENIGEQYRNIPTATMRMEPIPLRLKV